jgi:phospholipase C
MQENHSFDNFFGKFPGIPSPYGENDTVCNVDPRTHLCVKAWNADSKSTTVQSEALAHLYGNSHTAYDGGKMDKFILTQVNSGFKWADNTMAYYTSATLPNYWDYASKYALDVNFFSSVLSYSYPNHLAMVAGSNIQSGCGSKGRGGCKPQFNLNYETIITILNKTGLDWKYYAGSWLSSDECKPISSGSLPGLITYWNVLPDFPAIQTGQSTCHRIVPNSQFFSDVSSDYLPQVSWVTPSYLVSDHPAFSTLPNGQKYVASVVNAIMSKSDLWKSTVIYLSWDDFGGYFDHIKPNQVDSFGYGFRVPLIVISPYVIPGIYTGVNGVQEDFASILTTIEKNWNLGSCCTRDANEYSLFYMMNFTQPPLPPLIVPYNSLAIYPPSSCLAQKICSQTPSPISQIQNTSAYPQPSLTNLPTPNAEGDPYD